MPEDCIRCIVDLWVFLSMFRDHVCEEPDQKNYIENGEWKMLSAGCYKHYVKYDCCAGTVDLQPKVSALGIGIFNSFFRFQIPNLCICISIPNPNLTANNSYAKKLEKLRKTVKQTTIRANRLKR